MTLPLRMAAFERYMYTDDRPTHPMSCWVQLRFSGRFDAEAFRRAVATAVVRHPLLCARLSGEWLLSLRWVASPDPLPLVDIADAAVPMRFATTHRIDLKQENGLRIWVRTAGDAAEIRMQFHHSCCDGVGTYAFLEDVLLAYDHYARGESSEPELPRLDPGLLKVRGRHGMTRLESLLWLPINVFWLAVTSAGFFFSRPAPLAAPEQPDLDEDQLQSVPDLLHHTLSEGQLKQLIAVSRRYGASLTHLLFRDVLRGFQAWNVRHRPGSWWRKMRLIIPFNERRGPRMAAMPAANVVGMAFLQRRMAWHKNPRRLLAGIRRETRLLKAIRAGLTWQRSTAVVNLIPGGTYLLTHSKQCFATGVANNMGIVFRAMPLRRREGKLLAGDMVLEEVASAGPVRPLSSAFFNLITYAGRPTLVLNYDRRRLTRRAAEGLLATVLQQLERSAAEAE